MKKLSIFSVVALAAFCFASCTKDRVCECKEGSDVQEVTYIDATKRQAKSNCVSYSYDNGNGTKTEVECELK